MFPIIFWSLGDLFNILLVLASSNHEDSAPLSTKTEGKVKVVNRKKNSRHVDGTVFDVFL